MTQDPDRAESAAVDPWDDDERLDDRSDRAAQDTRERSPDLRLRGEPPRVMRLSRKALGIMATVACAGIGGALIYALQPQSRQGPEELYNTDNRTPAETISSAPPDYASAPRLGPPLPGDLGGPIVSAQGRGEAVPVPPIGPGQTPPPTPAQTAAEQARQRALQERDSARTSSVFLGAAGGGAPAAAGATPLNLPSLGLPAGLPSAPQPDATAPAATQPNSRRAFMTGGSDRGPVSPARLAAPGSPYILQAGSVIAAALVTGVRSDLPGQITAQVTENVYDSPTGRILVIPQGSRLIGDYDDQVAFGQRRVLVAWTRLILPDGRSIQLEREPAGDAAGFAGLEDSVNNHWGGLARAAGLATLLSFGAELAADDEDQLLRALRDGGQQTFNQAGQEIVRRQLNVPPTLTIRPGFPVRVLVSRDLVLAPWSAR